MELKTQIKNDVLVKKKRLAIARGAAKLFIEKGYYQTSIRDICRATHITIGNLYDYIKKKEDILYLVFDVFHSLWIHRLEEEEVFAIEDPIQQLETAAKKMLELVNEQREMLLLMYSESKALPKKYLKIILENERGVVKCFEKIIRKGIEKKVFKVQDPVLMSNIVVYLLAIEPLRGWNFRKQYKSKEIIRYVTRGIKFLCTGNL
jgi:TetR/AcrR family transcriptional regulator, cholesterol catabolism regulator